MLKHFDREKLIWDADLPPNEKFLLIALNSFVDANGECWPGQELLARMTGYSDRTIRGICDRLSKRGIIQRSPRYKKGGGRTSDLYKLVFSALTIPEVSADHTGRNFRNIPEVSADHTGRNFRNIPEVSSGDLSRENYSERSIQCEKSAEFEVDAKESSAEKEIFLEPRDADPFLANARVARLKADICPRPNEWIERYLKEWALMWEKSGRNSGDSYINLKSFIRKNMNPKADKHEQMLDEYEAVKAKLDRKAPLRIVEPASVPEKTPGQQYQEFLAWKASATPEELAAHSAKTRAAVAAARAQAKAEKEARDVSA